MALGRSWSNVGGAYIPTFIFSSQDHGRLTNVHVSKHSHEKLALTLKITVGCPDVHASMWAKITLCGHHLRPSLFPSSKKVKYIFFSKKSGNPGQDTQNEDNGHVRQQGDATHGTTGTYDDRERRCDMMMDEAQSDAPLQVGHAR